MYKYVEGPIMIGNFDIASIIDSIINFIVEIVKPHITIYK